MAMCKITVMSGEKCDITCRKCFTLKLNSLVQCFNSKHASHTCKISLIDFFIVLTRNKMHLKQQ